MQKQRHKITSPLSVQMSYILPLSLLWREVLHYPVSLKFVRKLCKKQLLEHPLILPLPVDVEKHLDRRALKLKRRPGNSKEYRIRAAAKHFEEQKAAKKQKSSK